MTFIGANIGDTAIIDPKQRFHLAPNVAKIEPNGIIDFSYLMRFLLSNDGRSEVFKSMKSTAQPSLSMTTIRDVLVPVAPLENQKHLADTLAEAFSKLEMVSDNIQEVKIYAKHFSSSLLEKAFSGQLVMQSESEGTGHDLLKQISSSSNVQANKAQEKKSPRRKKK